MLTSIAELLGLLYKVNNLFLYLVCTGDHLTLVSCTRLSTCFSISCEREIILPSSPVQGYPLVSLSRVNGRSSYLGLLYKAVHLYLYLVCTGDHLTLVSSCEREIILPWSTVQGCPLVSLSHVNGRSSYLGLLYKAVHLFLYLVCTGDHLTLVSCTRLSTCFSISCVREIILPWSPVQGCPLVSLSRVYGRSSYFGLLYKAVHLFLYLVCTGDHLTLVSCTRLSTCFSNSCLYLVCTGDHLTLVSCTRLSTCFSISCVREIIFCENS